MKNEKKATSRNKLVLRKETIREIRVKAGIRTGQLGSVSSLKQDQFGSCPVTSKYCTGQ